MTENQGIQTGPSLWQRFWRSPWTAAFFGVMAWIGFFSPGITGAWHWIDLALGIYWGFMFVNKADKRWGTP